MIFNNSLIFEKVQANARFTSLPSRPPTEAKLIVIILGGKNEWDVERENVIVAPLFDKLSMMTLYIPTLWSASCSVLHIVECAERRT